MSDTVGFIRKLPHQLIESFKSTLDEVREADILIHVLDISHPGFEDHYNVVKTTIAEIDDKQADKPTLVVFNKIDVYNPKPDHIGYHPDGKKFALDALKKTWMAELGDNNCLFISAQEKINIDELKSRMYTEIKEIFQVRYPYHNFLY